MAGYYDKPMSIMGAYNSGAFGNKNALEEYNKRSAKRRESEDFNEEEDKADYENALNEVNKAKANRNYYIANALSSGVRNFGKDLSNIAAAYTGSGNIDTSRDSSLWDARNANIAENATTGEMAGQENTREARTATAENLANAQAALKKRQIEIQMIPAQTMMKIVENPNTPWWAKGPAEAMAAKYAGADVGIDTIVATCVAEGGIKLQSEAEKAGYDDVYDYVVDKAKDLINPGVNINVGNKAGVDSASDNPVDELTKEIPFTNNKGETETLKPGLTGTAQQKLDRKINAAERKVEDARAAYEDYTGRLMKNTGMDLDSVVNSLNKRERARYDKVVSELMKAENELENLRNPQPAKTREETFALDNVDY